MQTYFTGIRGRAGRTMKRVGCIFAISLCLVSPAVAAPPLPAYGIDINQTSVSGVSSGGAMAVQMHVAYSSIMRGVGVIAGVAYDCANSDLPSSTASATQGFFV
jgi:poly(3-hydroxybutyrate) depolymerase